MNPEYVHLEAPLSKMGRCHCCYQPFTYLEGEDPAKCRPCIEHGLHSWIDTWHRTLRLSNQGRFSDEIQDA